MNMNTEIPRLLLGESRGARRRYGAAAVVFGVLAALVPIGVRASGIFSGPGGNMEALGLTLLLLLVIVILALTLPIAAGYRRAGLIISIAIPTCLILGMNVAYWTSVGTLRLTLWQWGGPPIGMLLGVPLGVAGYLIGAVLHQLR